MGGTLFRAGQRAELSTQYKSLIVSADLGFSQKSKSTGVAWQNAEEEKPTSAKYTFADAVFQVAQLLKLQETATLIVEAPLSVQFGITGNPTPRLPFEQIQDIQSGKSVNRFWYIGPGASTLVAAIFFLRRLASLLANGDHQVVLFEGLHTFKNRRTDHAQDAAELLQAFQKGEVVDVTQDGSTEWLSILQLIEGLSHSAIPAIVTVTPESAIADIPKPEIP